jgi:glycosyltransferase involved in cell wall biosynthesis
MTTLGIDGHRLAGSRSGVGRYLTALLREWALTESPFDETVLFAPAGIDPDALPPTHPFRVEEISGRGSWAFHWGVGRAARHVDLLFCPSYAAPLTYRGPFVVTVHDTLSALMPLEPGLREGLRHRATRRSARRARHVLTGSESSRQDIGQVYGVPLTRVTVTPYGCGAEFFVPPVPGQGEDVRARYALSGVPFFLFVGKQASRRNLQVLIEAFAAARTRSGMPHVLVLTGAGRMPELVGADFVRVTGYVPEPDLHVLYHEAEAFVYPSSYEGFGLPVLEAMAAGTPVLTARNSSLVEVAGDGALLVDEPSRDALEEALARLLTDGELREQLAARGRERARQFPWSRTAAQTMTTLASASSTAR